MRETRRDRILRKHGISEVERMKFPEYYSACNHPRRRCSDGLAKLIGIIIGASLPFISYHCKGDIEEEPTSIVSESIQLERAQAYQ